MEAGGGAEVYLAELEALNADVSDRPVDGQAMFQIDGDRFTAQVPGDRSAARHG